MTYEEVLLKPKEVEQRFKITVGTLANWRTHDKKNKKLIEAGLIKAKSPPIHRIGGRIYYDLAELQEWKESHRVGQKHNS